MEGQLCPICGVHKDEHQFVECPITFIDGDWIDTTNMSFEEWAIDDLLGEIEVEGDRQDPDDSDDQD